MAVILNIEVPKTTSIKICIIGREALGIQSIVGIRQIWLQEVRSFKTRRWS